MKDLSTKSPEHSLLAKSRTVSVIGTGDFGCGISKRLIQSGYQVYVGSRNPGGRNLSKRHAILKQAEVVSVQKAIATSDVILVAIPCDQYEKLAKNSKGLAGKILVDISNPDKKSRGKSNAETLADLIPEARVVKCFNTVSAYALNDDTSNELPQVYGASDDVGALETVLQIARDLGFAAHSVGRLQKARELESRVLDLFPGWGWPTLFTAGLFLMELLYLFIVMYILVDRYDISQIPTYVLYKASGAVSVNLLAFCYLPGILAAFAQLYYGNKHTRFQKWLDAWLLARKQLGIYSLMFGFMHMISVMSCMNGDYFDYLFKQQYVTIPVNLNESMEVAVDTKMNLHGEGCIATGLIALTAMGILGLTSLPPVGALLNWREWRFIQSQFGLVCFLLTIGHCMVHGVPRWMIQRDLPLRNSFMSLILPWLTLFLKILYFIPCVHIPVWRIRRGYERGVKYDPENAVTDDKYHSNEAFQPDSDSGMDSCRSSCPDTSSNNLSEESLNLDSKSAGSESSTSNRVGITNAHASTNL